MIELRTIESVTGTILAVAGGWQLLLATRVQPVGPRAQMIRLATLYQYGGLVTIGIATAASLLPDLLRAILISASIACTVTAMLIRHRESPP